MKSCTPGVTGYDLGGPISPECVDASHHLFTSTSTVSYCSRHLKYPCLKLHSSLRIKAIWKISYIVIYSSEMLFHTGSCVSEAKVNHVILCLSIMWKSRGSFFIKHLILIFTLSLIVTTLGKLIFLSLKFTLTFLQSISRVSQT